MIVSTRFIKKYITKTISYRLLSTALSILVMWIITGNIKISIVFGSVELIIKPLIYFLHEIAWHKWEKLH